MSFAPASLVVLRDFLKDVTGLSAVSLGIVGNAAHTRGYHLGRDRIYDGSGPGVGDADYSVKTARDRAGLTNAASAIDIGNFAQLRALSIWLVSECRRNAVDTRDIREVIYSPDGARVLRWDRERGVSSAPREGEADSSHLTHTHISWYRDSERDAKAPPFRRYFADRSAIVIYRTDERGGHFVIPAGTTVRGLRPTAAGWETAKTWQPHTTSSGARFDFVIKRIGDGGPPTNALHVVSGFFEGLYVSTASVIQEYDPAPPIGDVVYNGAIDDALRVVGELRKG